MLESLVEAWFCRRVLDIGGRTYKLKFLGVAGAPDRLALIPGRGPFFVELKRPKGGVVAARQKQRHAEFASAGVTVYVLPTIHDVNKWFKDMGLALTIY
jgi:hypothetical protein